MWPYTVSLTVVLHLESMLFALSDHEVQPWVVQSVLVNVFLVKNYLHSPISKTEVYFKKLPMFYYLSGGINRDPTNIVPLCDYCYSCVVDSTIRF